MRKVSALLVLVLAVFAFVSVAGASDFVTLKEYDADAYADMVDYYATTDADGDGVFDFTLDEAVAAADRITVDGVYPSDLVTPTPTPTPPVGPTPTPTVGPTGTCTQAEWEAIINAAVATGIPPLLQLSSACGV